jgi:hypothetical protein
MNNPYTPPKPELAEQAPKPSLGRKLLGGVCVFLGVAMLIPGIRQLVTAVLAVANPGGVSKTAGSAGGYLVGTLVGMALAALLVRFGIGRFRAHRP